MPKERRNKTMTQSCYLCGVAHSKEHNRRTFDKKIEVANKVIDGIDLMKEAREMYFPFQFTFFLSWSYANVQFLSRRAPADSVKEVETVHTAGWKERFIRRVHHRSIELNPMAVTCFTRRRDSGHVTAPATLYLSLFSSYSQLGCSSKIEHRILPRSLPCSSAGPDFSEARGQT